MVINIYYNVKDFIFLWDTIDYNTQESTWQYLTLNNYLRMKFQRDLKIGSETLRFLSRIRLTVSYLLFLSQSLCIRQMTSSCKCGNEGPLIHNWARTSWISWIPMLWQQKIKSIHLAYLDLLFLVSGETKLKWPSPLRVASVFLSRFQCCFLALV